ncbi:ECF transporter S component [Lactobacillus sp. LL6]|uniref:ECF transporter S component n=1 Tax=Lactobacillus sp. LL6 TaxID=2596827 RepID=UPI001184EAB4|nr:ECF transporter S component [Lactobacillus sp. LL6]TSO26537.1 ECF transporter S component [Lactobacillus sp. LL6]
MRKRETINLTITAIFTAILLLQTLVPNIGYIHLLPGLPAITTVPLTVALYASLMGIKAGSLFGLFWGITRLIMAYLQPTDMVTILLFQNPLIAIVPRFFAGFIAAVVEKIMSNKNEKLAAFFTGFLTSFTNTALVIGLASLVFIHNPASLTKYLNISSSSQPLILVLIGALGINGLVEMVFTGVLTPIILPALKIVRKKI